VTESLKLGGVDKLRGPRTRRLNRVPIMVAIVLVVAFFAVIILGLTSRGLQFGGAEGPGTVRPATNDADQLKRGIPDGIIGEPAPLVLQPTPVQAARPTANPFGPVQQEGVPSSSTSTEAEEVWRARLEREQQEQWLRELQRQRLASLQADAAALDSPIEVDLGTLADGTATADLGATSEGAAASNRSMSTLALYSASMQPGAQNIDPNGQTAKEDYFNQDIADLGYLPASVAAQMSPHELKRGSVIPATLVTGINSDLPGRITAQVSQNVYDSATGHHLLVPQGSKLLGRYDSKVTFGQNRVLVIWTDIIFPNGSTLRIGGMAGTDAAGYGGFNDKVHNHLLQTFGSAILVALIGAGSEMLLPQDNSSDTASNAETAARGPFAETFGQISEQRVSSNLNVQPTLEIRPGYQFNILVDQDILFPDSFR
jgi:type IV secretion system protein TrbI